MQPAKFAVLATVLLFAPVRFHAAETALPRSSPEAQGVASATVLDFIRTAEAKIDSLHSFMLVRRGHVVAEGWWAPYAPELPHQLYSLSKSFTSTEVGLAIGEGKFTVEDPVLKFFPAEAPAKPSANLRAMRVRDLLTMSTGHHSEDLQNFPYNDPESVVKKFLALPVTHKPGTFFVYNTAATYMLSAIVQKTTGQTVLDYLRPRLFEPLGIANPTWEASPQGVSLGGFGLSVRTEDIARFGQLYLQRGLWQGRQLVPSAWVQMATSRWMSNGSNPASDWEQGYGFQFWRCRYGVFRGDGAYGQFCIVFPDLDAVVAITSGTRDLQGVLNVVWDKLLPTLKTPVVALPADAAAERELKDKLSRLSLRPPVTIEPPAMAATIGQRRYVFPKNPDGIEAIALHTVGGTSPATELALTENGVTRTVKVVPGMWTRAELSYAEPTAVAVSGGWTAADTFTADVVRTHTPFSTRYTLKFADREVTLTPKPNVGPGSTRVVVGRVEGAGTASGAP